MKKSSCTPFLLLALGACAAPTAQPQPDSAQAASGLTYDVAEAQRHLDAGDPDSALAITDRLLTENPDNRAAMLIAAEGNIALFESGRAGQQYFLEDATSSLRRALVLNATDPASWLRLADLELKRGRFEEGRDAAVRAAGQLREQGAPADRLAAALLLAADNELQMFVNMRREELAAGGEPESSIELGQVVMARLAMPKKVLPGPAYARSGQVYQWLGQDLKAIEEYERGIALAPGDGNLHDALQGLYAGMGRQAECVAAYRRLLKDQPDSSLLEWHTGRAQVGLGDTHREQGRAQAADKAYADAVESFTRYHQRHPEHAENTGHWLAVCHISRAKLALDAGDTDAANRHNKAAFEATPRAAERDADGYPIVLDSFNANYLGLMQQIGMAKVDESLQATLDYNEELIARHPDRFGFIYNNAALAARDLGAAVAPDPARPADRDLTEAESKERMSQALALWERSYQHYEKAVALSPDDPRIVNDCGLMLIYHLHRDYDRARELFDRAIAVGEPQLAALGEDASDEERQFLEEAIGDAYQNVGVLMRQKGEDFEAYRSYLEDAVRFYPYNRRTAALLIRTRGGRDRRIPGLPQGAPPIGQQKQGNAFDEVRAAAEAKAAAGDHDGALLLLDNVAQEFDGHAAYHALLGRYSLAYAQQALASGGGASQVDGLFADAVAQLERAVELDGDPIAPRLELARAYAATGEAAKAEHTAEKLLSHIRSLGGGTATDLEATHRIRAEAATRTYITGSRDGAPDERLLQRARISYRHLQDGSGLTDAELQTWATLEQWAGAGDTALRVLLEGATRQQPLSADLLSRAIDLAAELSASGQVITALADDDSGTARWFAGRAGYGVAQQIYWQNQQEKKGDAGAVMADLANAVTALDGAIADFERAKATTPDFAPSSDQWIALCLGWRGIVRGADDPTDPAAIDDLLAAVRQSPTQLETDLGGGHTIKRALLVAADRYRQADDLGNTEQLFRRAAEAAPRDADFANNHGLFARDHASRLERMGKTTEANALYEASYGAYTRAAELEPDSIRLVNDRALLLIYHLDRDLDMARALLDEALINGERRLAEDPPTDEAALRDLQESVGDCYQNLGYYQEHHEGDLQAAQQSYQKSLTFYPFAKRDSTRHLARVKRNLGGGPDPVEKSSPQEPGRR